MRKSVRSFAETAPCMVRCLWLASGVMLGGVARGVSDVCVRSAALNVSLCWSLPFCVIASGWSRQVVTGCWREDHAIQKWMRDRNTDTSGVFNYFVKLAQVSIHTRRQCAGASVRACA